MLLSNTVSSYESDSDDHVVERDVRPERAVPRPTQLHAPSFEALCVPLWDEMLNFAKKLANGDAQVAQDVVQDAYVKAFRGWDRWTPPACLSETPMYARAWLFRVVQHEYIRNYNRVANHAKHFGGRDADVVESLHGSAPPSALDDLSSSGFCDEVATAVEHLTPDRRTAIHAFYVRGLSCQEIAAECKCPVATVHTRLNRAREDIARMIAHKAPALGLKQRRPKRQRPRVA